MKYNFIEANLPSNFCAEYLQKAKDLIVRGQSFTMIGIPAGSTSLFLKYLATQPLAYSIYLDMYALAHPTKKDFFLTLLKELGSEEVPETEQEIIEACRVRIQTLAKTHEKVVLIVNRFGELQSEFDKNFFGTLRTLSHLVPNKIIIIFSTYKPYSEIAPDAINGGNMHMFSEYIYFRPLSKENLLLLLQLHSPELMSDTDEFREKVKLSGGHLQLLQLLLKTERTENVLLDPYIKLSLKEIYNYLTYRQKKTIEKIAFGKPINDVNDYLLDVGLVVKSGEIYTLFSPLLQEYIKSETSLKLPVREAQLFKLLKRHLGQTVTKDEIFTVVWNNNLDKASDWALDSLIYRLRRNPAFQKSEYVIENNKKLGYTLLKN